jgi:sugar lactone lactonase YvrE
MQATEVAAVGAELAEGPIWVPAEAALWFVDISGRRLHRYQPDGDVHESWSAPGKASFVLPIVGGGVLVGANRTFYRFQRRDGVFEHVASVEPDLPGNRLNDACVDPEGGLVFGSMHDAETDASGSVYRLDASGRPIALDSGYVVTNGPAFSPSGRVFYHTDSVNQVIFAFDRAADGTVGGKRVFLRFDAGVGYPDGSVVDSEGCLWVAFWQGWVARRYSPDGECLTTVDFPCANVTKIAFGGPDFCTAYATTASRGLSPEERAAQPGAGNLFAFRCPVPGLPSPELDLGGLTRLRG